MPQCIRCKSPISGQPHGKERNQCERCFTLWQHRGPRITYKIIESDGNGKKVTGG